MRGAPGWTGIVIGLLCGALLGALLVIVRDRTAGDADREFRDDELVDVALPEESVTSTRSSAPQPAVQETVSLAMADVVPVPRQDGVTTSRRSAIVAATEQVAPAVVSINVIAQQAVRDPFAEFWERMGLVPRREYYQNIRNFGSGVIVSDDGFVLTNAHVVSDAVQVIVTLSDGRQFEAEMVEIVDRYDLAVLRIDSDDLPVAELGSSRELSIGEWAIAIGSPFGYLLADTRPTVTVGVISALNRDVKHSGRERSYLGMIQTDAAINPGNSGGPLVNTEGRVVGINTFIFTESGGSIGIGFAVPIERAQWVIAEVREFGRYREPNLGFALAMLSPGIVRYLGLKDPVGFIVTEVRQDSAAWKAGIRPRDIMREIDGVRLDSRDTVTRLVYEAMVGDRLSYVAERDGERFTGLIILEESP
jgi:serine protease Do